MTQTICRMYSSPETARAAAEELLEFRQLTDAIRVIEPPASEDVSLDAITKSIANCNVPRKEALVYAPRVQEGASLVVVQAPLFSAELVETCLDEHQPIPSGIVRPDPVRFLWDEAAPFSSALRLPTQYANPTPFSTFWNLPVLRKYVAAEREGMETIRFFSSRPGLFSGLFGWRMLLDKATPFSDFFGLPMVSRAVAPFSAALKLPTLILKRD
jgi:hypothetical protein